jgi:hypothetical protein
LLRFQLPTSPKVNYYQDDLDVEFFRDKINTAYLNAAGIIPHLHQFQRVK